MRLTHLNTVCRKFFKNKRLSNIILQNLDLQDIRRHFGKEFLSPIQQFALDGYTEDFLKDLPLDDNSVVAVFGGYIGNSSQSFVTNFDCNLEIYEPVPSYFEVLKNRFINNAKVSIYPYAVSDSSAPIKLNISGETSGEFGDGKNLIEVETVDVVDLFTMPISRFDCLEINIEGGEYSVLSKLISSGKIKFCKVVLVQFHLYGLEQEFDRAKIRVDLNKTHEIVKDYPWVWERWDLRK